MTLVALSLHLAGATVLLLYAVHLVRSGVENAYGTSLTRVLARGGERRIYAAASGTVLAVLLQSSTAVAMLASGLSASGYLTLNTSLAVLLGADLGSALVVRVLSFDLGWLSPLLLAAGGLLYLKGRSDKPRELGRMLLGIGFVLMSLKLIGEATLPLKQSDVLPAVVGYLAKDQVTAFAAAMLFTWIVHSSVAVLILILGFAAQGLLPVEAGLPLILGANLGSGLIAMWLTRGFLAEARRVAAGNLLFRAFGAAIALLVIGPLSAELQHLGATPAEQLVHFHLAFNACLVIFCLPLSQLAASAVTSLIKSDLKSSEDSDTLARRISALDQALLDSPDAALAAATREVLFMGEVVERMLCPVMELLEHPIPAKIEEIRRLDGYVNRAHRDIKLYLAAIHRGVLDERQSRRGVELIDIAINLEHAGDIVSKTLVEIARDKLENGNNFSDEGWTELKALHASVRDNMRLAFNLLVSDDPAMARKLVREKERVRALVRESHERHLARLRAGRAESVESSNMHLEVARALKEVNSLLATLAYPILKQRGDLLESRLALVKG
ncbi:Na/Pi cotransporter family protein [Sinorhizobium meliloti]|uniref:Na/Pi cotransporter family protein n=1 Tax=Rhizobium meliloti TaxID=382 RepID=UPI0003007C1E|nr:Na/Pi cotransporter family protein [Sinorhizobium meliloti]MDE3877865.1 Na/Pi cotransporter family protein [Sinorhizobium meliloti]MDW9566463.1 Na/Pi cotransporter family protein [Sinorhizobium meliloti]MDX0284284.1 Na/Pi cotransporter family protein [Sinorhizobium meliloti]MQV20149.1 Na/Pi cotransporter family protein [Sinorhizobium meliloti]RVK64397.1 Na/Pi cotransporter family protein [Sinorhizobium meliloti]